MGFLSVIRGCCDLFITNENHIILSIQRQVRGYASSGREMIFIRSVFLYLLLELDNKTKMQQ